MSRKGWTQATLRLGVTIDNTGRYVFATVGGAVRYADDGREPKMLAETGGTRNLWPAPVDQYDPIIAVTEGEPDALSLWELGIPAIGVPGTGKWREEWAESIAYGRERVYVFADCDDVGRSKARKIAHAIAGRDVQTFLVDPDPDRHDGYDVGDLLVDFGADMARRIVTRLMERAEPVIWDASKPDKSDDPRDRSRRRRRNWPATTLRTIAPHSEADPAALLTQTLVAFGNAVGRGPGWRVKGMPAPPTSTSIIVGETAKARKGISWGRVRQLLDLIDEDVAARAPRGWPHQRRGPSSTTCATRPLKRRKPRNERDEEDEQRAASTKSKTRA